MVRLINRQRADDTGAEDAYTVLTQRVDELQERVDDLERQLDEARQHNLRLAELTDVVTELLVPMAQRDEAKVAEAIDAFTRSV